jgi:hypothetical protein
VSRFAVFSDFRQAGSCIPTSASSRVAPFVSGGCAREPLRGMVSDFRQAESCIPTSASSRVASFVSGGCASEPLRGWFLISGKPHNL